MSHTTASTSPTCSYAAPAPYTLQELHDISFERHIWDLSEIQRVHQSILHHGLREATRLGACLKPFFDPDNEGYLFPPTKDPDFISRFVDPKNEIALAEGPHHLRSMLAQCAPSAVTYEGHHACTTCQASKRMNLARYSSCRQVFGRDGNAISGGACSACQRHKNGRKCSFRIGRQSEPTCDQDGKGSSIGVPRVAMPQNAEEGGSLAITNIENSCDLDRIHSLSMAAQFPFEVQVKSDLPAFHMLAGIETHISIGMVIKVGMNLPGTDTYQIDVPGSIRFCLKVEAEDLKTKVFPTVATQVWTAAPPGSCTPATGLQIWCLLRACKNSICRTISGRKFLIPAGSVVHIGDSKNLEGFLVIAWPSGEFGSANELIPLPDNLVYRHLALGTFEFCADMSGPRSDHEVVDFTQGERFRDQMFLTETDLLACGSSCEEVPIAKDEQVHLALHGGLVPLVWGWKSNGETFVAHT